MKADISIVNLNISNLHKTVIPCIKHTETLKNRSSMYYLYMHKRYLHNAFDAKIDVWNSICLYKSSYPVHFSAENINMLSAEGFFFTFKREKVLL